VPRITWTPKTLCRTCQHIVLIRELSPWVTKGHGMRHGSEVRTSCDLWLRALGWRAGLVRRLAWCDWQGDGRNRIQRERVQVRFCECEIEVVWIYVLLSVSVRVGLCELVSDFSRTWEPSEGGFMSVWVCVWEWDCVGEVRQAALRLTSGHVVSLVLPEVFSCLSNRLFTLTIHDTVAASSVHQCQWLVTNSHCRGSECVPGLAMRQLCWCAASVEFPYTDYSPKGPVSPHF
jgi:hypothetical protein